MSDTATLTRLPGALRTAAMTWAVGDGLGIVPQGVSFVDRYSAAPRDLPIRAALTDILAQALRVGA
jgi:hypothetical protein